MLEYLFSGIEHRIEPPGFRQCLLLSLEMKGHFWMSANGNIVDFLANSYMFIDLLKILHFIARVPSINQGGKPLKRLKETLALVDALSKYYMVGNTFQW